MNNTFDHDSQQISIPRELHPQKSLFGTRPEAASARDRLMLSNFASSVQTLVLRKVILVSTLICTSVGVAGVIMKYLDRDQDKDDEILHFFCEADLYGWLLFDLQLWVTILATQRIVIFEREVPQSLLRVEIFQTEINIYNEPLNWKEKLSAILYSVTSSIVFANFGYCVYRFFVKDENRLSLVILNAVFTLTILVNLVNGRQTVQFRQFLVLAFLVLVFMGGNYACSKYLFESNIYPEIDWLSFEIPTSFLETSQAAALVSAGFIISLVISNIENIFLTAKY